MEIPYNGVHNTEGRMGLDSLYWDCTTGIMNRSGFALETAKLVRDNAVRYIEVRLEPVSL